MSDKHKETQPEEVRETPVTPPEDARPAQESQAAPPEDARSAEEPEAAAETQGGGEDQTALLAAELETAKADLAAKEDQYLRLAAEFDNYRRRTQKEKDAIWADAKGDTAAAFLPVYDNLERALKQDTADAAYKKGVEMTMNQLREVLSKLGIEEIPALGETFDPKLHNAVMHVEDESAGENTVVEVFQQGFRAGEKVVRFAMVKVAN